jgi:hypothetical protein
MAPVSSTHGHDHAPPVNLGHRTTFAPDLNRVTWRRGCSSNTPCYGFANQLLISLSILQEHLGVSQSNSSKVLEIPIKSHRILLNFQP